MSGLAPIPDDLAERWHWSSGFLCLRVGGLVISYPPPRCFESARIIDALPPITPPKVRSVKAKATQPKRAGAPQQLRLEVDT